MFEDTREYGGGLWSVLPGLWVLVVRGVRGGPTTMDMVTFRVFPGSWTRCWRRAVRADVRGMSAGAGGTVSGMARCARGVRSRWTEPGVRSWWGVSVDDGELSSADVGETGLPGVYAGGGVVRRVRDVPDEGVACGGVATWGTLKGVVLWGTLSSGLPATAGTSLPCVSGAMRRV